MTTPSAGERAALDAPGSRRHRSRPVVSLVTCARLPEPDADAELLLESLIAAKLDATWVAWDDAPVAALGPTTVLRSTWNYYRDLPAFLSWVNASETTTSLWNPAPVVRWNAHKGYLSTLAERGLPVVPTILVPRGDVRALGEWVDAHPTLRDAEDLVVKPAVSAGSFRTERGSTATLGAHFASLVRDGDTLIQPYQHEVTTSGERCLIVLDGEVTHAVRKSPRFSTDAESITRVQPSDAERALALAIVATIPHPLLYARVDLIDDGAGNLRLMELELIEPSLFLNTSTEGLWRFVDLIATRARSGNSSRRRNGNEGEDFGE
ncbi:MAG: hypothetical protein IV100_19915 [Myxococcales bacterium]|nr:hypothetical protein [Myxococcales bacterium]